MNSARIEKKDKKAYLGPFLLSPLVSLYMTLTLMTTALRWFVVERQNKPFSSFSRIRIKSEFMRCLIKMGCEYNTQLINYNVNDNENITVSHSAPIELR